MVYLGGHGHRIGFLVLPARAVTDYASAAADVAELAGQLAAKSTKYQIIEFPKKSDLRSR